MTEVRKVPLKTGVTLNAALAGPEDAPPVIMLHGFPESHRTWRGLQPLLEDEFRLVMPDQRGFAGSDRPPGVEAYRADLLVDDIFALAEALGIERFALVGHDWGGAISWPAALRYDRRLARLAVINAPHPVIFQKSVIEDEAQRAASQYINAFRNPTFEQAVAAMGWESFFEKGFCGHVDLSTISEQERADYIAEWSVPGGFSAMLNWYRSSQLVVPPPGAEVPLPGWVLDLFPKVKVPTLVIWGMKDKALLPIQLEGLDELVEDLTIYRIPDAGHFVPWEKPDAVAAALKPFLNA